MSNLCTEEDFLKVVVNHELSIITDDGVNRFVRFKKPGTGFGAFDLITWPGCLCICGDYGTYVFRRLDDMFMFFRTDDNDFNKAAKGHLSINPGYWGEKLQAIGVNAGYREFDEEDFKERVTDHFNEYWEDTDYQQDKEECWEAIENEVLSAADDGEHFAYHAVNDFRHGYAGLNETRTVISSREYFTFTDFFDGGVTERYTFSYIWCLYAIAWGVEKYDQQKHGAIEDDSQ